MIYATGNARPVRRAHWIRAIFKLVRFAAQYGRGRSGTLPITLLRLDCHAAQEPPARCPARGIRSPRGRRILHACIKHGFNERLVTQNIDRSAVRAHGCSSYCLALARHGKAWRRPARCAPNPHWTSALAARFLSLTGLVSRFLSGRCADSERQAARWGRNFVFSVSMDLRRLVIR